MNDVESSPAALDCKKERTQGTANSQNYHEIMKNHYNFLTKDEFFLKLKKHQQEELENKQEEKIYLVHEIEQKKRIEHVRDFYRLQKAASSENIIYRATIKRSHSNSMTSYNCARDNTHEIRNSIAKSFKNAVPSKIGEDMMSRSMTSSCARTRIDNEISNNKSDLLKSGKSVLESILWTNDVQSRMIKDIQIMKKSEKDAIKLTKEELTSKSSAKSSIGTKPRKQNLAGRIVSTNGIVLSPSCLYILSKDDIKSVQEGTLRKNYVEGSAVPTIVKRNPPQHAMSNPSTLLKSCEALNIQELENEDLNKKIELPFITPDKTTKSFTFTVSELLGVSSKSRDYPLTDNNCLKHKKLQKSNPSFDDPIFETKVGRFAAPTHSSSYIGYQKSKNKNSPNIKKENKYLF